LITTILEPKNITPPIAAAEIRSPSNKDIYRRGGSFVDRPEFVYPPYYSELVSMIKIGHTRPNFPEFPQITDYYIRQAIEQVYNGAKLSKQAL
jgi:multiple sugar transport system substrate-binding protein